MHSSVSAGTVVSVPAKLASERVVVSAPMSFSGSAKRIWAKLVRGPWALAALLGILAVTLIAAVWVIVLGWYLLFGLLLTPYRLLRRGSRKRKRQALQHRELLDATRRRG